MKTINGMKNFEEKFFCIIMKLCTFTVFASLLLIVAVIVIKGADSMSINMITMTPQGGYYLGKEGGVFNAISGSFFLAFASTFCALAMSLPVALYINLYTPKNSKTASLIRLSLDCLWGVPSIVYGAFGFTLMVFLGVRASLLGGIITVSLLIFPIMTRAMDEVISLLPSELLDASYSLGATRFETAFRVVVRQTLPGIISAILIAFGRGIGDAASVLFTAGFSDRVPHSLFEPTATLPLAIFFQLGTPFPEVQDRAYASAFILTIIILGVSIIARAITARHKRNIA